MQLMIPAKWIDYETVGSINKGYGYEIPRWYAVTVVMVSYIHKSSALLPDEILQLLAKPMYKDACRDKYFEDGVMPILPKSKRSESQQVCIVVSTDTSPSEWYFIA